jgi:hypothetical protein
MNPLIVEENKDGSDPLLLGGKGEILFTTKKNDPESMHLNSVPISICATNISSYMGGRANPWVQAAGSVGLKNPYKKSSDQSYNSQKTIKQKMNFQP